MTVDPRADQNAEAEHSAVSDSDLEHVAGAGPGGNAVVEQSGGGSARSLG